MRILCKQIKVFNRVFIRK